jgi:hypothetical protein
MNGCNKTCHRMGKIPGVKLVGKKFVARIKINGRDKYLGSFDDDVKAYQIYMDECRKLEAL